jgi:hypothetical protein
MRLLLLLLIPLLVSCQTKETAARYAAAQDNALSCQERVIAYKEKLASQHITFKDERNALMYMVVQELAKVKASDELASCQEIYVAMINADAQKTGKLIDGSFRLGGMVLGIVGLDIIASKLSNGSTSGDTWNVSGSRVVNKSSGSSASGDGLGTANVFGGRTAQGGLEPRQFQTPDSATLEVNSGSLSGTNAPASVGEGGGNAPVTLPVEE